MLLTKKTQYTQITPIPSFIPRQLAIDFLHSHSEIIELNPLVTGHEAIKPPRDSPADEFYATWYEISQRIQYVPGIGKWGSGAIKFRGVFHDLPLGLQTHTYAPANVDLRNKWQICGNQPGEPPEAKELGSGAPPEGLYIREDVEIKCNVTVVSFVKKEMQAAAKVMLERLVKKAELLDSGALQGMFENGKLTTSNPADRTFSGASPQPSPRLPYQAPNSPSFNQASPSFSQVNPSLNNRYSPTFQRTSTFGQQSYQQPHQQPNQQQYVPPQQLLGSNNVVMELPGDFSYAQPQASPGFLNPHDSRLSTSSNSTGQQSPNSPDPRWSQVSQQSSASTRPSSYTPSENLRSPGLEQKNTFAAELPTMEETREEHEERKKRESNLPSSQEKYTYQSPGLLKDSGTVCASTAICATCHES